MKNKFSFVHEWQQFCSRIKIEWLIAAIFVFLYATFFYRYFWIVKQVPGNLVTFLSGGENIANKIDENIASLLFYIFPMGILGKSWVGFMKSSNVIVRIRQQFSALHVLFGEGILLGINLLWLILNQGLCYLFHLPFAMGMEWVLGISLCMLVGNILLLFHLNDAFLLGWVVVLILLMGCCIFPPTLSFSLIGAGVMILLNGYDLQKIDVEIA